MAYLEIYNKVNVLEYKLEVSEYQLGDIGLNFFTDKLDIDFDLFYKSPNNPFDEMNNRIKYDITECRGEEYFKIKLVDGDVVFTCDKCILGMVEDNNIFFIPNIERVNRKTKIRYYISFREIPKVLYEF